MTLNGVIAVTLHYFTEFGKYTFEHTVADPEGGGAQGACAPPQTHGNFFSSMKMNFCAA